ncbi:hypothetical protein FIBSPDRAFT_863060 [Athelia psychrophila]|uniref:Uncharacterized protein n=1 Tax=Athelia psychrophila TaxID=1759441 RepID=A0A166HR51_9AGAM|nr:hypothetical protein FIBSPDRAFT_863060 [Fibularhizoctonia sp. CBS 109695]
MCGNGAVEVEGRRCSPTLANPGMMDAQPSAASARPVCPRTKLTRRRTQLGTPTDAVGAHTIQHAVAMRVRLRPVPTSAHRHSHAPPPIPMRHHPAPCAHWLLSHICHVTAHDLCQHRPEDYPRAAIV